LLRGTANYQFKSEGWEYLEEIFEYHPHVIANVLNGNFGKRSSKFQKDEKYLEGVKDYLFLRLSRFAKETHKCLKDSNLTQRKSSEISEKK
jgi:hypothetical protein